MGDEETQQNLPGGHRRRSPANQNSSRPYANGAPTITQIITSVIVTLQGCLTTRNYERPPTIASQSTTFFSTDFCG